MNTGRTKPPSTATPPRDQDLAEQARPGHGIPSQDPDPAAQVALEPDEAEREARSVLAGGGAVGGAVVGAAVGVAVAGPLGVLVGGTLGAVAGVVGGAVAGNAMPQVNPPDPPDPLDPHDQAASASDVERFDHLPTSFGVFKPVGWLMVGVPSRDDADALATALASANGSGEPVQRFTPKQALPGLEAMLDNEGPLVDVGYEIVLVRRYVELAKQGHHWLLVKVDGTDEASAVAELARHSHAVLAIHYRTLTVEELI